MGTQQGPRPHGGQALLLGEPYWGLAGCFACLLRVLFGPYLRPRGLLGPLGATSKGLCSGRNYLPRGSLKTPEQVLLPEVRREPGLKGRVGRQNRSKSLRDSLVLPPPPAALRAWGRKSQGLQKGPQRSFRKTKKAGVAVPEPGTLKLGGHKGWRGYCPGVWHYLSSARMPTERDASAVTASTSASAPGTLGTQDSGQEARRCMQPQYLPGMRSRVRKGWGKQVPPAGRSTPSRPTLQLHISGHGPESGSSVWDWFSHLPLPSTQCLPQLGPHSQWPST